MSQRKPPGLAEAAADASDERYRNFHQLAEQWKRERGPYSSSAQLAQHPAYQQIIDLGPEVVPLLLHELERETDHWFRALRALTGADPVPPELRGNLPAIRDAWLRWGRDKGYRW